MVKLLHASLIATTGAGLGRNWLPKNNTDDLSSIPAPLPDKQGLAGFGFNRVNDPGNWAIWAYVLMT